MNWYLAVLKNYAGFSGRVCRQESWCRNSLRQYQIDRFPGHSGYLWSGCSDGWFFITVVPLVGAIILRGVAGRRPWVLAAELLGLT